MINDNTTYAYEVRFHDPPEGHKERSHYFFSLAAIFDHFTPSEVGCSVQALYRAGVREGTRGVDARCAAFRSTESHSGREPNYHTTE